MNSIISSPKRYLATEEEIKDAKNLVKSCIITRKGGMPISSLRDEYKRITDEEIPYLKLGYHSLFHFLRDIPEISGGRNDKNEHVLIVKENKTNKHLLQLINKQKDPKVYKPKKRRSAPITRKQARQNIFDEQRFNKFESNKILQPNIDENMGPPVIYQCYDFEKELTACSEPIVGRTQLIGDDYFLQLCIKYLKNDLIRKDPKSPITCGTVQSGLTIRKALKKLKQINNMSNRLCINLGTVDIYNRRTDTEIITDYKYLLKELKEQYGYANHQITLCTLPPMGNISMFANKYEYYNYLSVNAWLRTYAEEFNYKLLDFYDEFTHDKIIDYTYFQQDARNVSGTAHPHVLFNYHGRQKAMRLLLNL